jgi:hypothetical protein
MAAAGNDGYMLPEQVWDDQSPSGEAGFAPGEGTLSATPLVWSHAVFIRLAHSIDGDCRAPSGAPQADRSVPRLGDLVGPGELSRRPLRSRPDR